jgi:4-oxalocrotonate tautomerase family enzyme
MPIVRIEIGKHRNKEEKKELIHKVTEVVTDVLKEPKSNCMVLLIEIPDESWGVGGLTLEEQKDKYKDQ